MGAIRLFLALSVALAHLANETFPDVPQAQWLWFGLGGNWTVMMFFTVSGFLMSFVLDEKYAGPNGIWGFYRARFLRIYPLWWAMLALAVTVYPLAVWPNPSPLDIAATVGLIGGDWRIALTSFPDPHSTMPGILGLGWSLSVELGFYLVAPFLFRSTALAASSFGLSIALRLWVLDYYPYEAPWRCLAYYFGPTALPFFLLGHFARKAWPSMKLDDRWGALLFPVSVIIIQRAQGFDSAWFYLSIACFAVSLPPIFALTKNNRFMNFAGDLTYPLYLSHVAIIRLMNLESPTILSKIRSALGSLPLSPLGQFAVMATGACAILLPIAYVIHRMIERPVRDILEKILDGRRWRPSLLPVSSSGTSRP